MSWTTQQLADYQARTKPVQPALIPTDDELESDLHEMIMGWCRRQYPPVPYIHSRMDKKSTATKGSPDFILLLPAGKTLLVECKTKDGALSDDQVAFASAAEAVGHKVHIVRDYPRFVELIREM